MPTPFVELPENRSALLAVREVVERRQDTPGLVYLHGFSGCGKTRLVQHAVAGAACAVRWMGCADLKAAAPGGVDWASGEVLILEDLQYLPAWLMPGLCSGLDERRRAGGGAILTARAGPAWLAPRGEPLLPSLRARLVAGLVVDIPPLQPASKLLVARALAEALAVPVAEECLQWLAEHLPPGRQLHGALQEIAHLQSLRPTRVTPAELRVHFGAVAEAARPTLERLVASVAAEFGVAERSLRSDTRTRQIALGRHVAMYLARQELRLPLQRIAEFFGGRDHKTVLYACEKVGAQLADNLELQAKLGRLRHDMGKSC